MGMLWICPKIKMVTILMIWGERCRSFPFGDGISQMGKIRTDIDKSELIGPNLVISPVLGSIPVSRLSGGVKTLIQIAHDPEHVYNASACGDNCAAWLLRIGKEKDVLVRLGHQMRFTEEPFDIRIENTGQVVHTRKELVTAVISQGLLEETL